MKTKKPAPKRKPKHTTGSSEACQQRPCSPLEQVLAALLAPTVQTMEQAGISRLNIERDGSVLLQMFDGEVLTVRPPKPSRTNYVLGTLISWLHMELGDHNAKGLLEQLPRSS